MAANHRTRVARSPCWTRVIAPVAGCSIIRSGMGRMDEGKRLPAGTLTFLFTDIEGSTRLWEQHPDAMRVALARHDALLRARIGAHAGHVFKTVGDQFCAAFAGAGDAAAAALQAQRALHAEPWSETGPL